MSCNTSNILEIKSLRWASAVLLICTLALVLSGCGGSSRSVAAVCHVWDTQGLELHEKLEESDKAEKTHGTAGLLEGLVNLIGAPGELANLMHQMSNVAPTESEADFEALATAFTKLSESESKAITDPLGAIGGNIVEALSVTGPFNRVNAFLSRNCGIPHR